MYRAKGRESSSKLPRSSLQRTAQMSHSSLSCPESLDIGNSEIYMARICCTSVDTVETTGKPKACNPHQESVLEALPPACVFSSSLSSAGELSSPSPRLFSSFYIACQDCSYKTISHFLGLNEVQGDNIRVNVKIRLE